MTNPVPTNPVAGNEKHGRRCIELGDNSVRQISLLASFGGVGAGSAGFSRRSARRSDHGRMGMEGEIDP